MRETLVTSEHTIAQIREALRRMDCSISAARERRLHPVATGLPPAQTPALASQSASVERVTTSVHGRAVPLRPSESGDRANTPTGLAARGDEAERSQGHTTALMLAARRGATYAAAALLAAGADINATDGDGNTALMVAAEEGREGMVELLLRAGADPNARNTRGDSSRSLARGHRRILASLRAAGAR